MLASQWFCYRIFGILKNTNVYPVLTLSATVRAADADWNATPELDGFLYSFGEGMISVPLLQRFCGKSVPLASRSKKVAYL